MTTLMTQNIGSPLQQKLKNRFSSQIKLLTNPKSKSKSDFGFSLESQLTIYAAVPQVYAAVPGVYAAVHWVYAAVPSPGKV